MAAQSHFQVPILKIDFSYRMAFSNVCNYPGNIIQFTAKWKIFLPLLLLLLRSALAQLDIPTQIQRRQCEDPVPRIGSAWEGNLELVLNSLVENVNKTGYNISSHGQNGDKVYGLAQCRGDLNASTCRACVSNATKSLPMEPRSFCVNASYKSINLRGCFLRYANHSFDSQFSLSIPDALCDNTKRNKTDADSRALDSSIASLLTTLKQNAVSSNVGYSTLNESGLYSLAQCWRDLTMDQCHQCLDAMYAKLIAYATNCTGTSGVEALNEYCMLRYSKYKFYGDGVPLLSPATATGSHLSKRGKNRSRLLLVLITIPAVVIVLLLGVVIWKRKHKERLPDPS